MIAKYNGSFFCIDLTTRPINIWRYDLVEGFDRCVDDDLIYYEKYVELSELDQVFDVAFAVKWNGHWFGCEYFPGKKDIVLFTGKGQLINEYHFEEFERGAWALSVDFSACEEFQITYKDYFTKISTSEILSREEWINLLIKYDVELVPGKKAAFEQMKK